MQRNQIVLFFPLLILTSASVYAVSPPREQKAERKVPVSYYLYDEVVVDLPAEEVFRFILNRIPEVYTEMSKGHYSYSIKEGTPLRIGSHVDCHEQAGPQEVFNHYVVRDIVPDRSIYFLSKGSRILFHTPGGIKEHESHTHVYYDMEPMGTEQTKLSLTIIIEMPGRGLKFLGTIFGSRKLWRKHLTEELVNLGRIMEREQ